MNPPGDNPDLVADAVARLLGLAQHCGFTFTVPNERGSLWGERKGPQWQDTVFLNASGPCNAVRSRKGRLAPGEGLFTERVTGTALRVLHTVIYTWPT